MSKTSDKYISVFIPVFNGVKYLAACIESIIHQQLPDGYKLELIVIDSGSTDGSLDILRAYSDHMLLIQIPNSEFSHGGTRAHAAKIAKGEFVLFITQDATPSDYRWLINMVEPFFVSEKVGCVFGRQIPRPDAAVTIKREVATAFGAIGAIDSIILHREKSLVDGKAMNGLNTFFSDANSAVRRDLLIGAVPFRAVNYAEDQALAEDMQKHGYLKAYAPQGAVWHSNGYTAREYFKRKFDEFIGLQESLGITFTPTRRSVLLGWLKPTIADYKFILRDGDYWWRSKLKWILLAPAYNIANKAGLYYGAKFLNNHEARNKISLEKSTRK